MSYRILIADDEQEIINFLSLYLEKDGYEILSASNGKSALELINTQQVDLAIIDIMMPYINGHELIKIVRQNNNIPIVILSARTASADKVLGLGIGADDYITKPFDPLEVAARVDANIRRFYKLNAKEVKEKIMLSLRDLILDLNQCILIKKGEEIALSSIEFKILKLLMETPGRVFTKKQIYEAAWEDNYIVDDNNIMVYMSRIREKIGEREGEAYIKTIRGLGYKMLP
ncbi:response regulator transcription factor [Clostridium oryzae]|uniref:response regulator transcription factor n=1 Tax=Clostridium oryzae TaxID=1450648 RepID=UPI0009A4AA72|nr:response regulator transcription factor [Clostridium oryzae]